jgi:hypothetical protein
MHVLSPLLMQCLVVDGHVISDVKSNHMEKVLLNEKLHEKGNI